MALSLLLSFLLASVILALMPGPDNILVLTESITKGKKHGVALALGLSSGVLIHTLAAATGLSLIIQNSAQAFLIIKYLGGAYMFYLAIQTLKEKTDLNPQLGLEKVETGYDFWSMARKGFIMNVLNPKVSLFFIAFLPQFVDPNGINVTMQMIILGVIFMVQALIIFTGIASLSGRLSRYLNNDRFWSVTKYGKALVLSVLGLALIFSKK